MIFPFTGCGPDKHRDVWDPYRHAWFVQETRPMMYPDGTSHPSMVDRVGIAVYRLDIDEVDEGPPQICYRFHAWDRR